MLLKEINSEIESTLKANELLRDSHLEAVYFETSSEMATLLGYKSAQEFHKDLEKLGIITRFKIEFVRPLYRVKHPRRYGWRIAEPHREYLLNNGYASENCGPYKHSIKWRYKFGLKKYIEEVRKQGKDF